MGHLFNRLFRDSIWGPGGVHKEDYRLKFQLRVGYPAYYITLLTFGVFASIGGTPAMRQTFGDSYASLWGFTLAGTTLVTLVGIAFPSRRWRWEFYGAAFLLGLLFVYAVAVILAGLFSGPFHPDFGRVSVGFGVFAMAIPAMIRVPDIARDKEIHGWN